MKEELSKIKTGDVFLCGNTSVASTLVRFGTHSLYNHVAIALRIKDNRILVNTCDGDLYAMDTSPMKRYCHHFKKIKNGFAIMRFEDFSKEYNRIAVASPRNHKFEAAKIEKFIQQYSLYPFAFEGLCFAGSWLELPLKITPETSGINCAHLASAFYEQIGYYQQRTASHPELFADNLIFHHPYLVKETPASVVDFILGPLLILAFFIILVILLLRCQRTNEARKIFWEKY